MRYFKPGILAIFQNQSEKYEIQIDEFEGTVKLTEGFCREAEERGDAPWLSVAFGFRASQSGEWAVAAYGPDLAKASLDEQQPWAGFQMAEELFPEEPDERFKKWTDRYIMGSWNVPLGPFASLDRLAIQLNSICKCVVRQPLLTTNNFRRLCFPLAENNHRYHDAHSELYKVTIDALNKNAIAELGNKLGITVKVGGKNTVNALETLLTKDSVRLAVREPLDQIARQRRFADHEERPKSSKFGAFEQFGKDMKALINGFEILRDDIAARLDVNIARCEKRALALDALPHLDADRPSRPSYGIYPVCNMQGKTIVKVQAGELVSSPGHSESEEAFIVEFDDGSIMSIEAATNFSQLTEEDFNRPERLHISLHATYVPPMLPFDVPEQQS